MPQGKYNLGFISDSQIYEHIKRQFYSIKQL